MFINILRSVASLPVITLFQDRTLKKKKSHLTYPKSGPSTSPYLEGSLFSPIKVIYAQSKQTNKQKPQKYTIHGIQSEKSHTILSPRAKHVSICL